MEKSLIRFTIEKDEGILEAKIYTDEYISTECKGEFNKLITKKILNKISDELAIYHCESEVPVLGIILTEKGVVCNSPYLGFMDKRFTEKLQELTVKMIADLKNSLKHLDGSEHNKQLLN